MRRDCLIAGLFLWIALGSQSSEAQYTADFQTNIISGVTSNWSSAYLVGYTNFADVLVIQNSGVLSNGTGNLGLGAGSSNNSVVVTDLGSVWSNRFDLYMGSAGAGNSLVISNGGRVISGPGGQDLDSVGRDMSSSNNHVVLTGSGSAWVENQSQFLFGVSGAGNTLAVNNGGLLAVGGTSYVGYNAGSSNNSILVADSGSLWTNKSNLFIGYAGAGNSLVVSNGGQVVSSLGTLSKSCDVGHNSGGNGVLISGPGSAWNVGAASTHIGDSGAGNSLTIRNAGLVAGDEGVVGYNVSSSNNTVLVSGSGSTWSNGTGLYVGYSGAGNGLTISLGGKVVCSSGFVGLGTSGSSNSVRVADSGVWENNVLYVGYQGSSNSLVIDNNPAGPGGAKVLATNLIVGAASATCDNVLEVNHASLIVTNSTGTGVLEVRHGQLILNGGLLQADTLVMTNSCGSFIHTGGTLVVGELVLDPNTFRIVSIVRQTNDLLITWMMGPGATNALQVATGGSDGSYHTNGFSDIFTVTNNATIGTVTNYLDLGAATNVPGRYYRARLVP